MDTQLESGGSSGADISPTHDSQRHNVTPRRFTRKSLTTHLAESTKTARRAEQVAFIAIDWRDGRCNCTSSAETARQPSMPHYLASIPDMVSRTARVTQLDHRHVVLATKGVDEATAARIADTLLTRMKNDGFDGHAGVAASQPGSPETESELLERAWHAEAGAESLGSNRVVRWSAVAKYFPTSKQLDGASMEQVGQWLARYRQRIRQGYIESTMALVAAVEAREPLTGRHAHTVSRYCCALAQRLGLRRSAVATLRTAALLHDIGKIAIPDAILRKPGPLNAAEFKVMKTHPQVAVDILGHTSFVDDECPIILHHHERFDGRGYPHRLAADCIPRGARILAVADTMDAMLSARVYGLRSTIEETRAELIQCSGKQFDPEVVDAAVEWIDESPTEIVSD